MPYLLVRVLISLSITNLSGEDSCSVRKSLEEKEETVLINKNQKALVSRTETGRQSPRKIIRLTYRKPYSSFISLFIQGVSNKPSITTTLATTSTRLY
jgi:hypothetical protein